MSELMKMGNSSSPSDDERTIPFLFKCSALGHGLKSVSVSWQQLFFSSPNPVGRAWGLQVAEPEDCAVFIIDGSPQNAALRLLQDRDLALEVSFRKMHAGCTLTLWSSPQFDKWACRFCINADRTISPAEFPRPAGSGEVHSNVVLGVGGDGKSIVLVDSTDYHSRFVFAPIDGSETEPQMIWAHALSTEEKRRTDEMGFAAKVASIMSNQQLLQQFRRDGILHIPGLVSPELIACAREYLDRQVAIAQADGNHNGVEKLRGNSFGTLKALANCYNNSPLPHLMQALLGGDYPIYQQSVQIALRFPGDMTCDSGSDQQQLEHFQRMCDHWHIDGLATKSNPGFTDFFGELHNFDGLVGILLSDVEQEMSGELCAHPGSHITLAKYFSDEHALQEAIEVGITSLPTGDKSKTLFDRPVKHCTGRAGDVFILNFLTAHLIAPNMSNSTRYAIYFRIAGPVFTTNPQDHSVGNRKPFKPSLQDAWLNWKGLN